MITLLLVLLFGCNDAIVGGELLCDDTLDDDLDGLVDCEDPSCEADQACLWPARMELEGRFDYEPSTIASLGGAQECTIRYASTMQRLREHACTQCDRVYEGSFDYEQDDCPEQFDRPTSGAYGFVFTSEASWQFFAEGSTWTLVGAAANDGSDTYVLVRTDDLEYEGTDLGTIDTTYRFRGL